MTQVTQPMLILLFVFFMLAELDNFVSIPAQSVSLI